MYSLSIDYVFNRVYDVLLWIKYTWFFTILRNDPQVYLDLIKDRSWDGLRDRGWFDMYLANKDAVVPVAEVHKSLWQKILESTGVRLPDSDGDGIPDATDSKPHDIYNTSKAELKERYEEDYSFVDHMRDVFGIGPKDTDGDGVPDSYEKNHGMDPQNPDSDRDGLSDGQELLSGTNALNNDTDHDGIIDGRDEFPLDGLLSSKGMDTDQDGVSDLMEKHLGTNSLTSDTDLDGIPDGMDTYPLDVNNLGQVPLFDFSKNGEQLHFSIQNPVLALFADFLSVLTLVFVVIFVYAAVRWFFTFLNSLNHFEHHFESSHGHGGHHGDIHVIKHHNEDAMPAGIHNLPVFEEAPTAPPTIEEFNDHPKFAVIKGYMSSQSEALWRIGIMEADNLLEEVLRNKGYRGDNVSELLKNASFKTIDMAWDAHKVRNRIAHDGSDFELTEREAKRAYTLYESVFRELKVIG